MKTMNALGFCLFLALEFWGPAALAQSKQAWLEGEAAQISSLITASTELRYSHQLQSWGELNIAEVEEGFNSLSRLTTPLDQLIELKYTVAHWRHATGQRLLAQLLQEYGYRSARYQESRAEVYRQLALLNFTFDDESYQRLLAADLKGSAFENDQWVTDQNSKVLDPGLLRLLALHGKREFFAEEVSGETKKFATLAGPRDILQEDTASYQMLRFAQWSGSESAYGDEFSHYAWKKGEDGSQELRYRGLTFRSGDLMIVHFNTHGDGLFSFIGSPRPYLTHVGMLIFLQKEGRTYPTVIEMSLLGIRALPLQAYLKHGFTNYVEVYRREKTPARWEESLNQEVHKILLKDHGYDFKAEENERKFLACPEVPNYVFELTGVETTPVLTHLEDGIHQTLRRLGFYTKNMLSPTDYIRDPNFSYVGRVDNGNLPEMAMNHLFNEYLVRHFSNNRAVDELMPPGFARMISIIGHMQSGTAQGWMFRWLLASVKFLSSLGNLDPSFNMSAQAQMPTGSPRTVSFVALLDTFEADAIDECQAELAPLFHPQQVFSLKTLENELFSTTRQSKVKLSIERCLAPIRTWTKPIPK